MYYAQKPMVGGMPASDSIASASTAAATGLRRARPRMLSIVTMPGLLREISAVLDRMTALGMFVSPRLGTHVHAAAR